MGVLASDPGPFWPAFLTQAALLTVGILVVIVAALVVTRAIVLGHRAPPGSSASSAEQPADGAPSERT